MPYDNIKNVVRRAEPALMDEIRIIAAVEKSTQRELVNRALRAYVEAHKIEITSKEM